MFRERTLMCEGILLCAFSAFLLLCLKLTPPDDKWPPVSYTLEAHDSYCSLLWV